MSFDNYYPNRKDRRKKYYDYRDSDKTCRSHGNCPACNRKRRLRIKTETQRADEEIKYWEEEFNAQSKKDT